MGGVGGRRPLGGNDRRRVTTLSRPIAIKHQPEPGPLDMGVSGPSEMLVWYTVCMVHSSWMKM
jgi:hypothetical protein